MITDHVIRTTQPFVLNQKAQYKFIFISVMTSHMNQITFIGFIYNSLQSTFETDKSSLCEADINTDKVLNVRNMALSRSVSTLSPKTTYAGPFLAPTPTNAGLMPGHRLRRWSALNHCNAGSVCHVC